MILQNSSTPSFRMKGNRIYQLFVFFDVIQPFLFTGDPPCEFVKIPSLMVSEEYGIALRNATSLFAYSTFQNSDLAITIYLVCSVVILSIPAYQAFMLRLILRRSRFSFCSFFQFNLRPILCALIISVIWLALAFLMQHFGANEDSPGSLSNCLELIHGEIRHLDGFFFCRSALCCTAIAACQRTRTSSQVAGRRAIKMRQKRTGTLVGGCLRRSIRFEELGNLSFRRTWI